MSWLYKLGHFKKFAQNFPLSISGILAAKEAVTASPDMPGQEYLFRGPGVDENARMRGGGSKTTQILDQMLQMFTSIFDIFSEMKDEYNYDLEPDENRVEDEMAEYANMFMQDYQLKDDDIWSMIRFLDDDTLKSVVIAGIRPIISNLRKIDNLPEYWQRPDADRKATETFLQQLTKRQSEYEEYFETQMSSLANVESITRTLNEYQNTPEESDSDNSEILFDQLSSFTMEILKGIADSNNSSRGYRRSLNEELPEWLNEKDFVNNLVECDEADNWYMNEFDSELRNAAYESIGESDAEYFNEHKRELEHRFGFDVIGTLSQEYGVYENDERDEIPLSQLSEMIDEINFNMIYKGKDVKEKSSALIYAIKKLAETDETPKFIFSSDLNSSPVNPQRVNDGLNLLAASNEISILGPLAAQIQQLRELNTQEQERTRRELQEKLLREQEEEDQKHIMLPTQQENMTPEQLNRMKELGIAKRPFQHSVELSRGGFPGGGYTNAPGVNMVPFTMAISPGKDYLGQDKIPLALMQDMAIHKTPTKGEPALGWVGGYADYGNKVLYISEVQSDIMQRTPYMRDQEKSKQQTKEEINSITKEIFDVENKIKNWVSPRQLLQQKIQRINQENETLKARIKTQPQQTSIFERKMQDNRQLIDRLLVQLSKSPGTVDFSGLTNQLSVLQNNLSDAKRRLNNTERYPTGRGNRFVKEYPQWHDYKSKIENTFKEWIPIFFNSAFRLAKSKGYERVRIITSDALMKIWERFARPETKKLFERVYDTTAAFYGAQRITENNTEWWEVMMSNPDLRIAQNWLIKLIKKSQQTPPPRHEWLVQYGNKFVWQIHFDKFFDGMKKRGIKDKKFIFHMWMEEVPQELKTGNDLEPEFKNNVRQYLLRTQGFDLYTNNMEQNPETPFVWKTHLDKFFEVMKKKLPELAGEEQWGAQEGDYAANEGKNHVFQMWLEEVPQELKMGNDLEPEFKKHVREYVLQTQGFDPYDNDIEQETEIPSSDELEGWFNQ